MNVSGYRLAAYVGVSTAMTAVAITSTFVERPNFYSACVALSRSSGAIVVLLNMLLILAFALGRLVQYVFFGPLRALEVVHLAERAWFAVTETFLAVAMFRDSVSFEFGVFFALLTFLKVFHWIAQDRVDLIFQSHTPSAMVLTQTVTALVFMAVADCVLFNWTVDSSLATGGTFLVFAFDFALLVISVFLSAGKLAINLLEMRFLHRHEDEDSWDDKSFYVFLLESGADSLKLVCYTGLLVAMFRFYGLPVHVLRDVYITVASLVSRIRSFMRSQRAKKELDSRIANATEQDMPEDRTCIVCRDDMDVAATAPRHVPKKLSCGHVIHHGCLRSWLERSQRCPTCRTPVMDPNAPAPVQGPVPGQPPHPRIRVPALAQMNGMQNAQLPPRPFAHFHRLAPAQNQQQGQPQGQAFQNHENVPHQNQSVVQAHQNQGLGHAQDQTPTPTQPITHNPIGVHSGFQLPAGWSSFPAHHSGNGLSVVLNPLVSARAVPAPAQSRDQAVPNTSQELQIIRGEVHTIADQLRDMVGRLESIERRLQAPFRDGSDTTDTTTPHLTEEH